MTVVSELGTHLMTSAVSGFTFIFKIYVFGMGGVELLGVFIVNFENCTN